MAKNQNKSIYINAHRKSDKQTLSSHCQKWAQIKRLFVRSRLTHATHTQSNLFFKMFYTWLPRSVFFPFIFAYTSKDVCKRQVKTIAQYLKRAVDSGDDIEHTHTQKRINEQTIVTIIFVFSLTYACSLTVINFYFNCCMWSLCFTLLCRSFSEDEIKNKIQREKTLKWIVALPFMIWNIHDMCKNYILIRQLGCPSVIVWVANDRERGTEEKCGTFTFACMDAFKWLFSLSLSFFVF